jgi:predicted DsbA family dithiol-disulfide isomerase
MEVVFRHYFTDGKAPDAAHLEEAAREAGVANVPAALAAAADPARQAAVRREALAYSARGVSGVPYFLVNGRPAFSGAQPLAAFKQVLAQALAEGGTP